MKYDWLIVVLIGCIVGWLLYVNKIPQLCNNALMIRSGMPDFLPDPGVVPDEEEQVRFRIKVIYTRYHHTNMTDSGPYLVKREIAREVKQFLDENQGCE